MCIVLSTKEKKNKDNTIRKQSYETKTIKQIYREKCIFGIRVDCPSSHNQLIFSSTKKYPQLEIRIAKTEEKKLYRYHKACSSFKGQQKIENKACRN